MYKLKSHIHGEQENLQWCQIYKEGHDVTCIE